VRLAIVSDTHLPRGARRLPDACVDRLRAADLIVHAGDFTTASVLGDLEALGPPVAAVHGNVDEPALRMRLPAARLVDAEGARIAVVHDAGFQIFNPGSPTDRRRHPVHTMGEAVAEGGALAFALVDLGR
jgi:putative phosphoesterase